MESDVDTVTSTQTDGDYFNTTVKATMSDTEYYGNVMKLGALIISPLGIVSSLMNMATLVRQAFIVGNSFFATMLLVSLLELLFHLTYLIYNLYYRSIRAFGHRSRNIMRCMLIVRGVVFTVSLASDLLVLALTAERYLALCWMEWYRTIVGARAQLLKAITIVLIPLIACTRLHYTATLEIVHKSLPDNVSSWYVFKDDYGTQRQFLLGISIISDIVLPFILVFSMGFLTGKIIASAVARRKRHRTVFATEESKLASNIHRKHSDKPYDQGVNQAPVSLRLSQVDAATNTLISLTLVLDVLFFTNQLGYCAYALTFVAEYICGSNNTRGPFCSLQLYWTKILPAASIVESLEHSLKFFLYFAFSATFRNEVKILLKTVRLSH